MTAEISMKNTKKELLEIIDKMQQEISEKEKNLLNAEKSKADTKRKEIVEKTENIADSDLTIKINDLKSSINRELSSLAEKVEAEAKQYTTIQEAIKIKQSELKEIYGIEEQAASLAVLLESNNQTRAKFEEEMVQKRETLEKEIRDTRESWEIEKENHKEKQAEERKLLEKERKREEDEYNYNLQRSRAMEENSYADKLAALEKEIAEKQEKTDKYVGEKTALLDERERQLAEREKTMDHLEKTVENYPAELEAAVTAATEKKEQELKLIFDQEKALLSKGFDGDIKVLEAKISALDSLVKDQAKQIEKLNNQQEKAYQQVQDIAERAVTGAAERPHSITVKTTDREDRAA